jgi:hypothetical protein
VRKAEVVVASLFFDDDSGGDWFIETLEDVGWIEFGD